MTFVDYSTFTKVDPSSKITLSSTELSWSAMQCRVDNAYAYKDYGAGFFTGDFEHRFKVRISAVSNSNVQQVCYQWCLSNGLGSSKGMADAGMDFLNFFQYQFDGEGGYKFVIQECNGGSFGTTWIPGTYSVGTDYYVKIIRDTSIGSFGQLQAYIYSDSNYSSLVTSGTLNLTENQSFRYLMAANTYNDNNNTNTSSGLVANMDLGLPLIVYAISGVVELSGAPVEGAIVRCIRQSDNVAIAEQTTDSSGEYLFEDLEENELYHLAIEYESEGTKYNAKSLWDIAPYEVE